MPKREASGLISHRQPAGDAAYNRDAYVGQPGAFSSAHGAQRGAAAFAPCPSGACACGACAVAAWPGNAGGAAASGKAAPGGTRFGDTWHSKRGPVT
jgi:hypothetical protein